MGNSSSKTIGTIVVILIVVAGIWFMTRKPADTVTTMLPQQQAAPVTSEPAAPVTPVSAIQASGNSDAALDQDTASIDAQMNALNSDSSAAAQPVQ